MHNPANQSQQNVGAGLTGHPVQQEANLNSFLSQNSSWLCCYMAQMNPLIGPILPQKVLFAIQTYWVSPRSEILLENISVIGSNLVLFKKT